MLLGLRFSHKPKWAEFFPDAELIDLAEFDRVWRKAQRSSLWEQQAASSTASKWPHGAM
jgi:hypothetical protein